MGGVDEATEGGQALFSPPQQNANPALEPTLRALPEPTTAPRPRDESFFPHPVLECSARALFCSVVKSCRATAGDDRWSRWGDSLRGMFVVPLPAGILDAEWMLRASSVGKDSSGIGSPVATSLCFSQPGLLVVGPSADHFDAHRLRQPNC